MSNLFMMLASTPFLRRTWELDLLAKIVTWPPFIKTLLDLRMTLPARLAMDSIMSIPLAHYW